MTVRKTGVYAAGVLPRRILATAIAASCALSVSACSSTLQDTPIPHNTLEGLIMAPFPVYWLGRSFAGMAVTESSHDRGGAYTVFYGDCTVGGEGSCVHPLRVVSSPDNSFMPGGSTPKRSTRIRGVPAVIARQGRAIAIATAGVVLDIYATSAQVAREAAETAVPINFIGAPEASLPAPLPNTGYGETPLPNQVPRPLHTLG